MPIILSNKKMRIGPMQYADRKKPAICVEESGVAVVCGYFTSEKHAEFFMGKLAECLGKPIEPDDGDSHV